MEELGIEREEWLLNFLELPNGIPDSDTLRRVFERLNPPELSKCLSIWLDIEREKRAAIAADEKTIRGGGNAKHMAYHVVSAFIAGNQITLGEITVPEKTNEITAVHELAEYEYRGLKRAAGQMKRGNDSQSIDPFAHVGGSADDVKVV